MFRIKSIIIGTVLATNAIATTLPTVPPHNLTTHNLTNVWSEAFVEGTIRTEKNATPPNTTKKVAWTEVLFICHKRPQCWALVKMNTKGDKSVDLCKVTLDVKTGIITPEALCAGNNGYALTVNGPGEVTLTRK
ncbi:Uncharacterised protein (plasmid) [Legionella adelaidensis]|uniref:Uncharacterized protein n=1 Tax=Legionella adelaidensis TaxID=45056 RepID=A0A0W0R1R2_9GAMM|nr:hypothetical protein [Legionella adelaidensis]KTC64942.1 hypothetical protein Lade_1749 [Legionella adelaidensis]VEH85625.1 Uncharacterised protein [Legionella adelaidensis]